MKTTYEDRFWSKVEKLAGADCWLWTASINASGYGSCSARGREGSELAHRVAYELTIGKIPPGLQLDHLCRTRSCVRPDHLEPVTNHVNVLRGQNNAAQNARKAKCKCGSEYSYHKNGKRFCWECRKIHMRFYMRRYRAEKLTQQEVGDAIERAPGEDD